VQGRSEVDDNENSSSADALLGFEKKYKKIKAKWIVLTEKYCVFTSVFVSQVRRNQFLKS